MFLFTDFISDENTKYGIGFSMISFIGVLLVSGLGFVIFFGIKATYLLYKRHKNRFMHKYFPEQEEHEDNSEASEEQE